MLNLDKVKMDSYGYYYLGEYHAYWRYSNGEKFKNPQFDEFSDRILNLKKSYPREIKYFTSILDEVLINNKDMIILCAPSHQADSIGSIHTVVDNVCSTRGFLNGSECLSRYKSILKLAHGGNRSVETHLESIRLIDSHLLENKDILLIDDVTTSGNTLKACSMIIKSEVKNIRSLTCLVFAKTV